MVLVFFIIIFLILVRESIIDIETMYVPDNITFALYSTSIVFIISKFIYNHSFKNVFDSILGFLFGFGVPFMIALASYFIQKLIRGKSEKSNNTLSTSTNGENVKIKTFNPPKKINALFIKRCIFVALCIAGLCMLENTPSIIIGLLSLTSSIIVFVKNKEVKYPIYIISLGLLAILVILSGDYYIFLLIAFAFIAELVIAKIFKRFYKIEEDDDEDTNIAPGIGGGDIFIFGALGLMFGLKGIITIFIYSTISQLLVIFSYKMITNNKTSQFLPFVPGITIGVYVYLATILI
jgi:prepilin signal peptidase PulO-like enzyme (type II secretory pathway)